MHMPSSSSTKLQFNRNYKRIHHETYDGLDCMMAHFDREEGYRLPRTIMTGATIRNGTGQVSVDSREKIMKYYKEAKYEDCYLNAYLDFDTLKEKYRSGFSKDYKPKPTYLLIDLDRKSFDTDEHLGHALQTTLKNIDKNIDAGASDSNSTAASELVTIIWSGNGYHVHVPLRPGLSTAIEDIPEFSDNNNNPYFKKYLHSVSSSLTDRFLRFAERKLSEGMADKQHNPSIDSSLFRVPGTINTRAKNAGKDPIVKLVKLGSFPFYLMGSADGTTINRIKQRFLNDYHAYLVQEIIDYLVDSSQRRQLQISRYQENELLSGSNNNRTISWIDKLIHTAVDDRRKELIFWVLAPYLMTVKGLEYDKAYHIIEQWLEKCNEVRRLEPGETAFRYRIRYCLDTAEHEKRKPIRLDTFKEYYPEVYNELLALEKKESKNG